MYIPRFPIQNLFALLLFGLLVLGASPVAATPFSLQEAQEQNLFNASAGKTLEEKETLGILDRLKKRISQTWNEGNVNLIVPVYTWHNRFTYERERIRKYNENPWGGGLGLSFFDEDGDTHMLYLIAFLDSWSNVQPYGGYAFLKNWHFGSNNDFRAGAGVALGITAREQFHYVPFLLPLPVFGVGYKRFSMEAAYIPGIRDTGNVLFTWLRWTF